MDVALTGYQNSTSANKEYSSVRLSVYTKGWPCDQERI